MSTIWIKKLLLFAFPVFVFPIIVFFILHYRVDGVLTSWSEKKRPLLIYLGDSQVQVGVNDTVWANEKSYAAASEPIFFTFYKLKFFSSRLPTVKTVALGLNYHSFSEYYDEFIFNESPKFRNFHLLSFKQQVDVMKQNHQLFRQIFRHVVNRTWEEWNGFNEEEWLGKFEPRSSGSGAEEPIVERRIREQFYNKGGEVNGFSLLNEMYLDSIQWLCQQSGWDLLLFQNPVSRLYFEKVPKGYVEYLDKLRMKYQPYFIENKCRYWPDSLFLPDGDHLNTLGSRLFTDSLHNKIILRQRYD